MNKSPLRGLLLPYIDYIQKNIADFTIKINIFAVFIILNQSIVGIIPDPKNMD